MGGEEEGAIRGFCFPRSDVLLMDLDISEFIIFLEDKGLHILETLGLG